MQSTPSPRFVALRTAAERTGLSAKVLKKLGREGAITVIRARNQLLVDAVGLDQWIRTRPTLSESAR